MRKGGALVTGSARGIGRGIARALAQEGYDLAIHYRCSAAAAEEARQEVERAGARAVALQADVTDLDQAGELVRRAHAELGSLRVLVNNVGNYVFRPLPELALGEWEDMLASNLSATFATCRAAIPLMRAQGGGRIVNIGYAGAQNLLARPNIVAYAIAKTGVVLLTKAIAKAEAAHGITANVVAPGVIENSRTKPLTEIPAGRVGTIEEVASVVVWFCRPETAYVTGQVIEVAGGWNL
ncbi:MAG: bifunctional dihydropteridine reductase/dihydrofolate reductase TmpR [Thermoleophilia bacterium]